MNTVFISYSHADSDTADVVASILEDLGIEFYRDQKDIEWGDAITTSVREGLESAAAVIVIISPGSLKSQWVPYEIGYATALRKRVLPYLTHPSIDRPGFITDLSYAAKPEQIRDFFDKNTEWPPLNSRVDIYRTQQEESLARGEAPAGQNEEEYWDDEDVRIGLECHLQSLGPGSHVVSFSKVAQQMGRNVDADKVREYIRVVASALGCNIRLLGRAQVKVDFPRTPAREIPDSIKTGYAKMIERDEKLKREIW